METDTETGLKFCARCCEDLPPSAFGSNRSTFDGLTAYCLPCKRAVEVADYAARPERVEQIRQSTRRRRARQAGVGG